MMTTTVIATAVSVVASCLLLPGVAAGGAGEDSSDVMGQYALRSITQCQRLCWYRKLCAAFSYSSRLTDAEYNCVLHADPLQDVPPPEHWTKHEASKGGIHNGCAERKCGEDEVCVPLTSRRAVFVCLPLPAYCKKHPVVLGGTVKVAGTRQGHVTHVTCNPGFNLIPAASSGLLVCHVTSQWMPPAVMCELNPSTAESQASMATPSTKVETTAKAEPPTTSTTASTTTAATLTANVASETAESSITTPTTTTTAAESPATTSESTTTSTSTMASTSTTTDVPAMVTSPTTKAKAGSAANTSYPGKLNTTWTNTLTSTPTQTDIPTTDTTIDPATSTTSKTTVFSMDTSPATTEIRCENGGTPLENATCLCPLPYAGIRCHRLYRDCQEAFDNGHTNDSLSRFMRIQPMTSLRPFRVYCRFLYGGITRILDRRAHVAFNMNWTEFSDGIAISEDYFVGLKNLHHLTTQSVYMLRIKLRKKGANDHVHYNGFSVGPASSGYSIAYSECVSCKPSGSESNGFPESGNNSFHSWDHDTNNCYATRRQPGWYGLSCHGYSVFNASQNSITWPLSENGTLIKWTRVMINVNRGGAGFNKNQSWNVPETGHRDEQRGNTDCQKV